MVLFNTVWDAAQCMETCEKYGARAPIFSNEEELSQLLTWHKNTTQDPITNNFYEELESAMWWLPMRYKRHSIMI